jgi:hypothetical protein
MLKKTIEFKDLEGKTHTRDFYFHIKKDLLIEQEMIHEGGFKARLQGIIDSKNGRQIMDAFKEIIAMSVGEKSEDGLSFLQSKERSEWFMGTDAYTEFFMELVTDADGAAKFINAIMPSDVEQAAAKMEARMKRAGLDMAADTTQDSATANLPTPDQLSAMSKEDLARVFEDIRSGKIGAPANA